MSNYGLYLAYEQSEDPPDLPNTRLLRDYKKRLDGMRNMVLLQISHPKITQNTMDTLERDLSEIIGGIDKLRHASNIDELLSSRDGLLAKIRSARMCLNVAFSIRERANTPRNLEALYTKFEEFADLLLDAIEMINL